MMKSLLGVLAACVLGGCAAAPITAPVAPDTAPVKPIAAEDTSKTAAIPKTVAAPDEPSRSPTGPWIGAAGASDFVMAGVSETVLGVWVDVPSGSQKTHAPAA